MVSCHPDFVFRFSEPTQKQFAQQLVFGYYDFDRRIRLNLNSHNSVSAEYTTRTLKLYGENHLRRLIYLLLLSYRIPYVCPPFWYSVLLCIVPHCPLNFHCALLGSTLNFVWLLLEHENKCQTHSSGCIEDFFLIPNSIGSKGSFVIIMLSPYCIVIEYYDYQAFVVSK